VHAQDGAGSKVITPWNLKATSWVAGKAAAKVASPAWPAAMVQVPATVAVTTPLSGSTEQRKAVLLV
jgi:hypothetical protein